MTKEAVEILEKVQAVGFDTAIAHATDAEVQAGAACGQLSIIAEVENE